MWTKNSIVTATIKDTIREEKGRYYLNRIVKEVVTDKPYTYDWTYPDCESGTFYRAIINGFYLSRDTVSNFDMSRITKMTRWFTHKKCSADISCWDVSNVLSMEYTFHNAEFARGMYDVLNNWDPISLKKMIGTFGNSRIFHNRVADISGWFTPDLEVMRYTFTNTNFNLKQLRSWDMGSVKSVLFALGNLLRIVDFSDVIAITNPSWKIDKFINRTVIAGIKAGYDDSFCAEFYRKILRGNYLMTEEVEDVIAECVKAKNFGGLYNILMDGRAYMIFNRGY